MKTRLLSLLLALALMLSLATVGAAAAVSYSDLTTSSWCWSYVETLSGQGVLGGYADGSFRAKNNVTKGAMLKMVLQSLYPTELAAYTPSGSAWHSRYTEYAEKKGYVSAEIEQQLTQKASRTWVADLIVACAELYDGTLADSSTFADPVDDSVLTLCELGILCGSMTADGQRYFSGSSPITRGAAAAIAYRLKYGLANTDSLTSANTVQPAQLSCEQDYYEALRRMMAEGLTTFTVSSAKNDWDHCEEELNDAVEQFMLVYPEYYGSWTEFGCGLSNDNAMTIYLYYDQGSGYQHVTSALAKADEIRKALYADGKLTASMTDREKAKVYFDYLQTHTSYSYDQNKTDVYGAYGALINGSAVCLGYTGALNRFLKLEGISCAAAMTDTHIWTAAELDGKKTYIDATNNLFDVSAQELREKFGAFYEH